MSYTFHAEKEKGKKSEGGEDEEGAGGGEMTTEIER